MGTALYAGFKTREDILYKERERRGCEHRVDRSDEFCSKCGKPNRIGKDVPIKHYDRGTGKYKNIPVHTHIVDGDDAIVIGVKLGYVTFDDTTVDITTNEMDAALAMCKTLREDSIVRDAAAVRFWLLCTDGD